MGFRMANEKKTAMVSGITGQDGGYLAKFYLKKVTEFLAYTAGVLQILFQN